MLQSFLMMMLMVSTFIFSQLKHPLAMGFLLLIQTTLICFITGMMTETFWFSYILFLVFLGGMLVLFIYVTSLASNEMFNFSFKLMILSLMGLCSFFMLMMMLDNMEFTFINNMEMNLSKFNNLYMENVLSIYKLYNFPTNWMTCLMINYLLFTLIVVVKITNFFYGPLRNLN